mgnify:CR=1 FL=1
MSEWKMGFRFTLGTCGRIDFDAPRVFTREQFLCICKILEAFIAETFENMNGDGI